MARKTDTGWRDSRLVTLHQHYGHDYPAAGMALPMVEYDNGKAVGLVSYLPVDKALPYGAAEYKAYGAFSNVDDGFADSQLPFLTASYDVRDWSFQVFPHNLAAQALMGRPRPGWTTLSEAEFAAVLYGMRGRELPDLSAFGVTWNSCVVPFPAGFVNAGESWPGQRMSIRRREYEPFAQIDFRRRIPCTDIDFAVIGNSGRLCAVVDYKLAGRGSVEVKHHNARALASMTVDGAAVAAFVIEYSPERHGWLFRVHCVNDAARDELVFAMGHTSANTQALAHAVGGGQGMALTEIEWFRVLDCIRGMDGVS